MPFSPAETAHQKARRWTKTEAPHRERILKTSLRLFNDFGEPNVTTTVIADEMNISPATSTTIFTARTKSSMRCSVISNATSTKLGSAVGRRRPAEDIWLFVHLLFEIIWRNRYLYRDLPGPADA